MAPSREVSVTRPRAAWGRTVGARPRLLQVLGVVAVAWVSAYLVWRVGWSRHGANPVLWAALLAVELYGLWSLATFLWTAWSLPAIRRPEARTPRTVDVMVCAYEQPADLLRATLAGCAALNRPHLTWVLDDAGRGEVAELAAEYGAGYLTRPSHDHGWAGGLDAALPRTDGELLFVLRAGEVPMPDALDAVTGWFEDPQVALVQTAREAGDHGTITREPGGHEQPLADAVLQPGLDRHGAARWHGSAVMLRRSALDAVGGIAEATTAEDLHTTLRLQASGRRARFHDEVLVQGLARRGLAGQLRSRERHGRGVVAILRTPESPLRRNGLPRAARLAQLAELGGLLAGPARILTLLVLAAILWTGALPMTPEPLALAALWLPALVLALAARSGLARGYETLGDRGHIELVTAQPDLRVLASALRPAAPGTEVPPRRAVDAGGRAALRAFPLLNLAALALGLGLLWRVLGETGLITVPGRLPGWAAVLVLALGAVELRRIARTLRILASRRELRRTRRVPVAGLALIRRASSADARDQPVTAKLLDLSPDGAGLVVPEAFEVSEIVTLTLLAGESAARGATHVRAQVARVQPGEDGLWTVGVRLTGNPPEVHRRIAELCATNAPMWRLRGAPERSRPHGTRRAA